MRFLWQSPAEPFTRDIERVFVNMKTCTLSSGVLWVNTKAEIIFFFLLWVPLIDPKATLRIVDCKRNSKSSFCVQFPHALNSLTSRLTHERLSLEQLFSSFSSQVHYLRKNRKPDHTGIRLHITTQPQPNLAGIYMMYAYYGALSPGRRKQTIDVSCRWVRWNMRKICAQK